MFDTLEVSDDDSTLFLFFLFFFRQTGVSVPQSLSKKMFFEPVNHITSSYRGMQIRAPIRKNIPKTLANIVTFMEITKNY